MRGQVGQTGSAHQRRPRSGSNCEKPTNFRWCGDALGISSRCRWISHCADGSARNPTMGCIRSSASDEGLFRWILPNRSDEGVSTANSRTLSVDRPKWSSRNLQFGWSDLDGERRSFKFRDGRACATCHELEAYGALVPRQSTSASMQAMGRIRFPSGPLQGQSFNVTDLGWALITDKCADVGKVKGPILHGLTARAPYFSRRIGCHT